MHALNSRFALASGPTVVLAGQETTSSGGPAGITLAALPPLSETTEMVSKVGLANNSILTPVAGETLSLAEGRRRYEDSIRRPLVAGGPRPSTQKRYRAVLDKLMKFAAEHSLKSWQEVNKQTLDRYASWLEQQGYAYATQYLELNTIKQILKFLVQEGALPQHVLFPYSLRKAVGIRSYCWQPAEVQAILGWCRERSELNWLVDVLLALSLTGLRISELAGLRWSDLNLETNILRLADERAHVAKRQAQAKRTTRSGRSRHLPIHPDLLAVLQRLPRTADNRVFHGPLGGKLKPDTLRRILIHEVLKPLSEKIPTPAGEQGFQHGRLHSFRHYFCSQSAHCGVPEQVVMEWVGHRESGMVRHYYHLHDQESQRQMLKVRSMGS